jgi:RNA polymerase sigma-70 factor (ECF subfamily)
MDRHADVDWIDATVKEFEGPLVRYAARITGDLERARDVVQDTFLKLWKQPREAVDGHLAEWLFTVCRHGALDVRRKENRMNPSPDVGATLAGPDTDPGAQVAAGEAHARLLQLMGTLPESQQEVLRLKFQNGLSYGEIGQITKRTANHVGVLIHTGLKTLRAKAALRYPAGQAGGSPS